MYFYFLYFLYFKPVRKSLDLCNRTQWLWERVIITFMWVELGVRIWRSQDKVTPGSVIWEYIWYMRGAELLIYSLMFSFCSGSQWIQLTVCLYFGKYNKLICTGKRAGMGLVRIPSWTGGIVEKFFRSRGDYSEIFQELARLDRIPLRAGMITQNLFRKGSKSCWEKVGLDRVPSGAKVVGQRSIGSRQD